MRTITAKKRWLPWLKEKCIALSGGNLLVMRRSFWGNDAYVVKCLGYLFRVSESDFAFVKNNSNS